MGLSMIILLMSNLQTGEFTADGLGVTVKGRLGAAVDFWCDTLDASEFVWSIIKDGYRLPFAAYSSPCFLRNNLSALKHKDFVSQAILELLAGECISEHAVPSFCVNPLTVAEGKKLRLVIDLRHVNEFLAKPKSFEYEKLRSLSQVIDEGYWFFTWDLKSGYPHVDICEDHQQNLGFSWVFGNGERRYFSFSVLPFGLRSALFVLLNRCVLWLRGAVPWVILALFTWMTVLVVNLTKNISCCG